MFSDKTFQIAFLISAIAHGFILLQNSNVALLPPKKNEQKFEVSYIKAVEEPKAYPKSEKPQKKEQFLKIPAKITVDKRTPPPFIDKEGIFNKGKEIMSLKQTFTKPEFIKSDIVAIQKKITLPPIDIDKINNPSYISYYQLIREKIRRAAYRNYTRNETGEVYLSFIISSDGYLKEVQLSEERSSPNPYLKEIALRSIKEASPFPDFPKELDYPQLSFNVVISFEIE
jgi:TonB family protein